MPARRYAFLLFSLFAAVLAGCTSATVVSSDSGPTISQVQAESAHGPKKRIAVMPFEYKAAKGSFRQVGHGLSQMLTEALVNSNAFIVEERSRLNEVMEEQNLGDTGRFNQSTVAQKGQLEGAQLLVYGSVTEFEVNCRGGALLLLGAKESCVGINIRIVDAATGRVVNSTSVEGTSGSGGVGLVFATTPMPIGLGAWSHTPMEQAMRRCIDAAVKHIVATKL